MTRRILPIAALGIALAVGAPASAEPGGPFVGIQWNFEAPLQAFVGFADESSSAGNFRLVEINEALEAGDYARAGKLAISAPRPADPVARYLAGIAQAGQRDYIAARRLLKAAVVGRRAFTEAETALALVQLRLGDTEAAVALRDRIAARRSACRRCEGEARLDKAVALIDRALG